MAAAPDNPALREASDDPPRRFSSDRVLGVLLILLQLGILGNLSGARAFPLVLGATALWGLGTRLRLRIDPTPLNLIYAMMTIGFLLKYMFAPYELPLDMQFIRSSLAHSIARLLICVQVLQLFLHQPFGYLPIWLGGCGAVTLSFAMNLRIPSYRHHGLLIVIAAFIGVFALYGGRSRQVVAHRRPSWGLRTLLMSACLLAALSLGSGASWALQKHERNIEWFLSEYLGYGSRSTRTGFTPRGRLQSVTSWKAHGGEQVMLRLFADKEPGYLRGKVFDTYQGSSKETSYTAWVSTLGRRPLPKVTGGRNLPELRGGDQLYELSATKTPQQRVLDVWPEEQTAARLFMPLGASLLAVNGTAMQIDGHGIVTFDDRIDALPYMVFANPEAGNRQGTDPQPAADIDRVLLTSLDGQIDPEVRLLAAELFDGCRTTRDKLDAVQHYFVSNYQYKQGINVPHRMDPVTYFLIKKPPAHCEYFATGTAVLLRLADVPCRYVVGYKAGERNDVGGFWVARNKDAHAWVEAYDDEAGAWVIVESTPAAGVPQPRQPHLAAQVADSFRHRLSIWRMRLREYGVLSLLASFAQLIWSIPGLIIVLALLAAALSRFRPQLFVRERRPRVPAHLKGMHHALVRLDRQARRQGFSRRPDETLTQFADRLRGSNCDDSWSEAAARCYTLYVDLRYQGNTGPDAIGRLREAVARIPSANVPR